MLSMHLYNLYTYAAIMGFIQLCIPERGGKTQFLKNSNLGLVSYLVRLVVFLKGYCG